MKVENYKSDKKVMIMNGINDNLKKQLAKCLLIFCFLLSKWLQRNIFQNLLDKRCQMKRKGNISGDSNIDYSATPFSASSASNPEKNQKMKKWSQKEGNKKWSQKLISR